MTYPYGTAFKYLYYPLLDNEPVEPSNEAPSIYVYTDTNVPTRSQAIVGDGDPEETIGSWTKLAAHVFEITIPALEDPDPASTIEDRTFWIAINYTLASSGQSQLDLRALPMTRPRGMDKVIETNEFHLTAVWSQVMDYVSTEEVTHFIRLAKELLQADLRGRGYEWDKIHRADRFTSPVTYKALSLIAFNEMVVPDDGFAKRHDAYESMYKTLLDSLKFEYDTDGDGEPDTDQTQSTGTIFFMR